MLSKKAEQNGKNWDEKLLFVLFAYRTAAQESTGESPFQLLYGCNPKLPTEDALSCPVDRTQVDLSTADSQKFQHPNYSAPLRKLIVICSKVWRASQIFQLKVPKYFDSW